MVTKKTGKKKLKPKMETVKAGQIYNSVTGKYHAVYKRTEANPDAGSVRGIWSKKKED